MTRADIETMRQELATTTAYLRENGRRIREIAEHVAIVSDQSQEVIARIDAAITAGLMHLHGDEDAS